MYNKNSSRTSKCQVFSSTVPEIPNSWTELARQAPLWRAPGALKGAHFRISYHPFCCKISKKYIETGDVLVLLGIVYYVEKLNYLYDSVPLAKWSNLTP